MSYEKIDSNNRNYGNYFFYNFFLIYQNALKIHQQDITSIKSSWKVSSSEEDQRRYGPTRYKNLSEHEKQMLLDYRKKYGKTKTDCFCLALLLALLLRTTYKYKKLVFQTSKKNLFLESCFFRTSVRYF